MTTAFVGRCARCQRTFEVAPEVRVTHGVVVCPHCGARYRVAGTAGIRPTTSMPASDPVPASRPMDSPAVPVSPPPQSPRPSPPPAPPVDRTTPMGAVAAGPGLAAGDVLAGRYQIRRFIAQGGMGAVYEAQDLELGLAVALKTLHASVLSDPQALERFKREIQFARKVTHPNVCRIFDFGSDVPPVGRPVTFYTMELVEGETLADLLRREGALEPDAALPLVRQMADALAAAHRVGVIHRDFKSENVFLAHDATGTGPRVVVADFGIARADEAIAGRLTSTGEVLGTPAYMSPEQLEGRPLTGASDIYSLGLVVFEMVTGRLPFQAETAISTAVKRLTEAPPSPRSFVPDLDPRWEAAILRCLERRVEDRFQTPEALVEALSPQQPVAAVPSLLHAAQVRRQSGKRRVAVLLLILLAVAAASAFWRVRQQQEAASAPVAARRSVAVAGFRDLSGQSETAWLSTALAEMLSTELAAGGDLRVVPGELVARARRELEAPPAAATQPEDSAVTAPVSTASSPAAEEARARRAREVLGVDFLIDGSYAVLGANVRLDVRLLDAASGRALDSIAQSGSQDALFDLVRDVGTAIRQRLGVGTAVASTWWSASTRPEATRLYAEGVDRLRAFDIVGGRDLLERAVEAEPTNPAFRSALASAWSTLGYPERALAEARRAFDLAAQLPPGEKLAVEGRYWEIAHDWGRAASAYEALFAERPDDLETGLRLATVQAAGGQGRAALATVSRLRELPTLTGEDPRVDLIAAQAHGVMGEFARQQETAQRAAVTATERRAWLLVAEARIAEGLAARALGQPVQAQAAAEEARRLYAEAGDQAGVANAYGVLAGTAVDQGALDRARGLYDQALLTYRQVGDLGGTARTLNNIAVVLRNQGDLAQARTLYEESLRTCRESGDRVGLATALNNLAAVRAVAGELDAALELLREALALRRELGDRAGESFALANLGTVLHARGEVAGAAERLGQALVLRRALGQKLGEGLTLVALGRVRLDVADLGDARQHLVAAAESCKAASSAPCEAEVWQVEGDWLRWSGRHEEAATKLAQAIERQEAIGDRVAAAESRVSMGLVQLEVGNLGAARTTLEAAAEASRAAGARDVEIAARAALVRALWTAGDAVAARRETSLLVESAERSESASARILARLAWARGEVAAGRREVATREIAAMRDTAETRGLELLRVESELTAVELGVPLGAIPPSDVLETLQQEAQARGLGLVNRRALLALASLEARTASSRPR